MTDQQEYTEAKKDKLKHENYIKKYLPIVRGYASRFSRYDDYEDLCQEGAIGLLIAFDRYDPSQGVPFNHYCRYWIRNKIQDYLWRKSLVKVTREVFLSGDTPRSAGEDPLELEASCIESAYEEFVKKELKLAVSAVLEKLTKRDESIIKMYFGIHTDPKSYKNIGEILGYSKQRIQQIVKKALDSIAVDLGEHHGTNKRDT